MRAQRGWVQGYNGQAVVAEVGLIVATELVQDAADVGQLEPTVARAETTVARAGFGRPMTEIDTPDRAPPPPGAQTVTSQAHPPCRMPHGA